MEEPTGPAPGLFASLQRVWRALLAVAQNRLELLLVEWEEERRHAVQALLLTLAAAVLGLMTLVVGTFFVVMFFWEDRVVVLLLLFGFYLLGAAGAYWKLRRLLNNWSAFPATLDEIKKDKTWLEGKN
jgi:uncharacterized membrane protein YqjE